LTPARPFSSLGVVTVSIPINRSLLTTKLIFFAGGLTSTEKAVLLAIAEHLGGKKVAWPSYSTIAHYAGIDRSTAYRTINKLKERGLLTVIEAGGCNGSNRYEIDTRALARLIANKKYQKRAVCYLQRLGTEQANGCTVQPEVVAGRNQGGCTVQPERPTHPQSETSPVRETQGVIFDRGRGATQQLTRPPAQDESQEETQLSDHIKHHELSETFHQVEVIRLSENDNPMVKSTRPPGSVAASVVKLMNEVKQEAGRYPDAMEIVAATNDEKFTGLKQLSWGLLTGSLKRGAFKELLLSRIRGNTSINENSGATHDRRVEELKRDAGMQDSDFLYEDDE
jgi:predicted transcriptional regulator